MVMAKGEEREVGEESEVHRVNEEKGLTFLGIGIHERSYATKPKS